MTTALALANDVAEALEFSAMSWPEKATALAVRDEAGYAKAGALLVEIKSLRAEIADACTPVIQAAHKAHRAACDQKMMLEAPLVSAEGTLKRSMSAWYAEDQRRRQEEARQRAEAARKAEDDARVAEAVELEHHGETELAEQVLAQPSVVATAPVTAPKVAGIAAKESWGAQVDDLRALCRAIAAGEQPVSLVEANMPALNQMARALKAELRVPGVRAVMSMTIAAGKR